MISCAGDDESGEASPRYRSPAGPRPEVKLVNDVDDSTLPLSFYFTGEYAIREGILKDREGFITGCNRCSENGRRVGYEYTSCECLEFANVRENGRKEFPDVLAWYTTLGEVYQLGLKAGLPVRMKAVIDRFKVTESQTLENLLAEQYTLDDVRSPATP